MDAKNERWRILFGSSKVPRRGVALPGGVVTELAIAAGACALGEL